MSLHVCDFFSNKVCQFTLIFFSYLKMQIGKVHKKISLRGEKDISWSRFWLKIASAYLPKYILRKILFFSNLFGNATLKGDISGEALSELTSCHHPSSLNTLLFISCYDNGDKVSKVVLTLLSINLEALNSILRNKVKKLIRLLNLKRIVYLSFHRIMHRYVYVSMLGLPITVMKNLEILYKIYMCNTI